MKIAFATEDFRRVDAHFGWAQNIMVYDLNADSQSLVRTVSFGEAASEGNNEDKIAAKVDAIKDCAIVYVADIGGPAAARVVASKIHPIKAKGNETIQELLDSIKQVMNGTPPPWLRKAMLKDQPRPADFDTEAGYA